MGGHAVGDPRAIRGPGRTVAKIRAVPEGTGLARFEIGKPGSLLVGEFGKREVAAVGRTSSSSTWNRSRRSG
jgi:hypothetical protein